MKFTWSSFNNTRLVMLGSMPIVIFYLVWLVTTAEGIRAEESTLLDLVCWPDGRVIPVIVVCGSAIAVVVELYGLYQLFKAGLPRREYNVTNGLCFYIWSLIVVIIIFCMIIFYCGLQTTIMRARIKGGIMRAMHRYGTHLPSKIAIDKLQTRFHCCGRLSYEEWFYISWYRESYQANRKQTPVSDDQYVGDNIPFSCCSTESMAPCIHHGITRRNQFYKQDSLALTIWQEGCEEKLIREMVVASWALTIVMGLIIIAMGLQLTAARYLHTAYQQGLHAENQIVCEAFLLRSLPNILMRRTVPRNDGIDAWHGVISPSSED